MSGSLEIDFRILTYGPCAATSGAPGTFDEVWIARGTFTGTFHDDVVVATFSYVADVKAGGDVRGTIVLGDELSGTLEVRGNFADGLLSYRGRAEPALPPEGAQRPLSTRAESRHPEDPRARLTATSSGPASRNTPAPMSTKPRSRSVPPLNRA
jgi:hypothetical protein